MAEMLSLYNQIEVLTHWDDEEVFFATEKPDFNEIGIKLHNGIIIDEIHKTYKIGEKMIKIVDRIPIFHALHDPTFLDVMENIPHLDCEKVYVFVTRLGVTVGGKYVSCLEYGLHAGFWISNKHVKLEKEVFRVKPDSAIKEISDGETRRRYDQVTPLRLDLKKNTCSLVEKPPIDQLKKIVYQLESRDLESKLELDGETFTYDRTTQNILKESGGVYAQFITEIPTVHNHAYYGCFRPSLDEVLCCMPNNLFTTGCQLVVSTVPPDVKSNRIRVGEYNVGRTLIWCKSQ